MGKQNMHCQKAMRQINSGAAKLDRDIAEHIKSCPTCARAAESALKLRNMFESAGTKDTGTVTPFAQLKSRIEGDARHNQKETIMSILRDQFAARPKLFAGLGLALAVFLFITLVPFSYTTTVGYSLTYADLQGAGNIDVGQLTSALDALGYGEANIQILNNRLTISKLPDENAAREAAVAFTAVTGVSGKPVIEPVTAIVSGSLYAQVMDKITVEVDAAGKTDQEIADEIRQKLLSAGMINPDVNVTTSGDEMQISVSADETDGDGNTEDAMQLEFKLNGTDNISFDAPTGMPSIEVSTEGKTADQVKAEIEAKLAAEGKEGANVEVIPQADGRFEIRVTFDEEVTR